jgi:hypothetical protein
MPRQRAVPLGRAVDARGLPHSRARRRCVDCARAAEMAAILFFLEALGNEGLDELAYREARALTEMVDEPYKSAGRMGRRPSDLEKILITGPALKSAPLTWDLGLVDVHRRKIVRRTGLPQSLQFGCGAAAACGRICGNDETENEIALREEPKVIQSRHACGRTWRQVSPAVNTGQI